MASATDRELVEPVAPTGPLPRAARQEAILRGAARAFARTGYAGTSMEDIAAASGITKLIVYRHFDSKEELYRAVLQRVFDRLAEEFVIGYSRGEGGVGARSLLTVAREDPDGFQLLWRQAAREPQFADYARELRERSVDASRALLAGRVAPDLYEWAAHTIVDYLVEAVLNWLEHGDPGRDEELVGLATAGARAGVRAWTAD
jgi:AcrR family transcriptional regulator